MLPKQFFVETLMTIIAFLWLLFNLSVGFSFLFSCRRCPYAGQANTFPFDKKYSKILSKITFEHFQCFGLARLTDF